MADPAFEHPRLARLYDPLDPDRSDLLLYADLAAEFAAHRVLDIGCGTGTLALVLAERGHDVVGLDPACASLDVARAKPGAERVRWVCGTIDALPALTVDLVTMTGNVAQAIIGPADWAATLAGAHAALEPGGRLVFETRIPALRAWQSWTRTQTESTTEIPDVGAVTTWCDLLDVALPLVSFRWTYRFADGAEYESVSTLRFRERDEITASLQHAGFVVDDIRDAPDRPGREWVFVARRPD